jgi:hypothetical protein
MNNRRSEHRGWGGGGRFRHGGPIPVEPNEVERGGGRGWCRWGDHGEVHGVGFNGVPRGGGRGRCWGGGHGVTDEGRSAAEAAPWRLVEELRRKVEALEQRLEGQSARHEPSPTPDAP